MKVKYKTQQNKISALKWPLKKFPHFENLMLNICFYVKHWMNYTYEIKQFISDNKAKINLFIVNMANQG